MVNIKNTQRKIKINTKKIENYITQILEIVGYNNFDIGIWFTTNETIKKYNKKYRNKNKPTDILSFPFYPNLQPGEKIKVKSKDQQNLGDIIISLEYAKKDALKLGRPFYEHLKILLVHGICHLLGHTHETEKDYKKMHAKEAKILTKIQ
ncbi:rRNA maturation RNase YbeY [Candidatus Dependentiae bacterium]